MKTRRLLLLLLIISVLLLSSCAPPEVSVTVTKPTEVEQTLPPPAVSLETDIAKLWTKPRTEHHPLRGGDFQNRALDQLLYEPLFSFRNDGVLLPMLAESASFSGDGLIVTVRLKAKSFSNGQQLTANDAATSLSVWFQTRRSALGLGGDSSGGGSGSGAPDRPSLTSEQVMLGAVDSIAAGENNTLVITLNRRVDNVLSYLTCPILTAEDAGSLFAPTAPGTSSRKIEYISDTQYKLTSSEAGIKAIDVEIFSDAEAAIRAFQAGQLDVVFLSPDEYALYGGRQNVRFQSISVPSFLYLSFNAQGGYFSDPAHVSEAKQLMLWQNKLLDHAVRPHRRLALPVDLDDRRLPFEFFDSGFQGELPKSPGNGVEIKLLRGTDRLNMELGENMRLFFERFGYKVSVVEDSSSGWDISLDRYDFSAYPDAYDFFAYAENGRFAYLLDNDREVETALIEGRTAQIRLEENVPAAGAEYKDRYQKGLNALMDQLPLVGLAAPCGGVAYSSRVQGLLTPQYYCFYDGLEKLVVWPHP